MKCIRLYIPHGSDNTQIAGNVYCHNGFLYIPHGSDNTTADKYWKLLQDYLYIPHGSDNTYECPYPDETKKVTLYPTWFR